MLLVISYVNHLEYFNKNIILYIYGIVELLIDLIVKNKLTFITLKYITK